jgi:hypothetical protein
MALEKVRKPRALRRINQKNGLADYRSRKN